MQQRRQLARAGALARTVADEFRLPDTPPEPILAITIGNRASGQRYQGLVPVENPQQAALVEGYFVRSEQLPTRVLLASDGDRGAGLMLQRRPGSGHDGATLMRGIASAICSPARARASCWMSRRKHFSIACTTRKGCVCTRPGRCIRLQCTRERVAAMLHSLGRDEVEAALREDGVAEVTCEFCNTRYHFDAWIWNKYSAAGRMCPRRPASSSRHVQPEPGRLRPRKQEALAEPAAQLRQGAVLRLGFDAFGDHLHAKRSASAWIARTTPCCPISARSSATNERSIFSVSTGYWCR